MQKTVSNETEAVGLKGPDFNRRRPSGGTPQPPSASATQPAPAIAAQDSHLPANTSDSSRLELNQFPEAQLSQLRQDILAARALQLKMLPSKPPHIPGYEVTAFYDACDMLAGDFFLFTEPAVGYSGFLIADVSGHGVTAAMIMAASLKTFTINAREERSPRKALIKLYRDLQNDLPKGRFITAFYMILNHSTGVLQFARAGHNPPFLCLEHGGEVEELKGSGLAIGLGGPNTFENHLEECEARMMPGASLLLYSDGFTEAHDVNRKPYGEERLKDILSSLAGLRCRTIVESLINDLHKHTQTDNNEDDLTLMLIKRK